MKPALPVRAETAATIFFVVVGAIGLALSPGPPLATVANGFYYAVLVFNTYFSIRFFTALPPEGRDERIIDGVLVAIYVVLALAIGRTMLFTFVSGLLFGFAMAKYQLLKRLMNRRDVLDRKIAIDGAGLLLGALAFAGAWLGYELESAWVQAILFAIANIYLLAIKPMYAA